MREKMDSMESMVGDPTVEEIKAVQKKNLHNADRDSLLRIKHDATAEIIKRLKEGEGVVDVAFYLFEHYKIPLQLANEIVNTAINETVGQMDHSSWTSQYRMQGQRLVDRALDEGKIAVANAVLGNMIKLQILTQGQQTQNRKLNLEEEKFKVAIQVPEPKDKTGEVQSQGFRIQIESVSSTQSTPKETSVVEIPAVTVNTAGNPSQDK